MEILKSEKGYIECGTFIGIIFILLVIVGLGLMMFGNLCLDFASGSHRITPTSIDTDMWGNYKVYFKTSEYTQNSQENYYSFRFSYCWHINLRL